MPNLELRILEKIAFSFPSEKIIFLQNGRLELRRGVQGGQQHFVDIALPCGNAEISRYVLQTFGSEEPAKKEYKRCKHLLDTGNYQITANQETGTAEIAEKHYPSSV